MTASMARFVHSGPSRDVEDALAVLRERPDVAHIAVMPDVHLAEDVCVGTVVATTRTIYPAAVGGDIGCGMLAARLDVGADAVDARAAARLLAGFYERIPRDRQRARARAPWPQSLDPGALSAPSLVALARHEGAVQLGTLGSGNHFVELQRDEDGGAWLMLHSGSRAMGPAVRRHHEGAGRLAPLDADGGAGRAYLADMAWALAYAEANRQLLLEAVAAVSAEILGAAVRRESIITCHHNHVRRELHGGRELWVHRKGAIPAAVGELGIVPGSMGAPSFHVVGRGHAEALASAAHGAGRRFSRAEARRRISALELGRELGGVFWDHRRADVLRDEAPGAYKDIGQVMRAQRELVRVVRRVEPVLAFKGA
jgi:tRNA-splicing ligase RtcB (3'-phosphate/5'-hydroxy nucleic acid ligase)